MENHFETLQKVSNAFKKGLYCYKTNMKSIKAADFQFKCRKRDKKNFMDSDLWSVFIAFDKFMGLVFIVCCDDIWFILHILRYNLFVPSVVSTKIT